MALVGFHASLNVYFVNQTLGRNFRYSRTTKAKLHQDRNCEITANWLLHGSKWLQDNQVSSLKPTTSIQLLKLDAGYVLRPYGVFSKKKLTGMYCRAVFTAEKMIRCYNDLLYPTPLFDGVSWPWSRLRRFGGFSTRQVLGP